MNTEEQSAKSSPTYSSCIQVHCIASELYYICIRKGGARFIKTWMTECSVDSFDWPTQNPDLILIEHLGAKTESQAFCKISVWPDKCNSRRTVKKSHEHTPELCRHPVEAVIAAFGLTSYRLGMRSHFIFESRQLSKSFWWCRIMAGGIINNW